MPAEQRGGARHKVPEGQVNLVNLHIRSFPVKETHYGSNDVKYLDSRLNIKKIYGLFKAKYPGASTTYSFHKDFFNNNFHLRFGRPQVDECSKCEELTLKVESRGLCNNAKRAAAAELEIHKQEARLFYKKLSEVRDRARTELSLLLTTWRTCPCLIFPFRKSSITGNCGCTRWAFTILRTSRRQCTCITKV